MKTLDINGQTRLGELVTFFPAITSRLNELHIDYCCKGDRPIGAALEEAGLPQDLIAEVRTAYDDFLNRPDRDLPVSELSNGRLIELILEIHHQTERALWKELDQLINKLLLVHYKHGKDLLLKLHRSFSELRMELEEHFAKEEEELFPAIQAADKAEEDAAAIRLLINELENEHESAGQIIKRIISETEDFKVPDYACPTMKAFYVKLHELIDDIFLHIQKENSVLFKRYE